MEEEVGLLKGVPCSAYNTPCVYTSTGVYICTTENERFCEGRVREKERRRESVSEPGLDGS